MRNRRIKRVILGLGIFTLSVLALPTSVFSTEPEWGFYGIADEDTYMISDIPSERSIGEEVTPDVAFYSVTDEDIYMVTEFEPTAYAGVATEVEPDIYFYTIPDEDQDNFNEWFGE